MATKTFRNKLLYLHENKFCLWCLYWVRSLLYLLRWLLLLLLLLFNVINRVSCALSTNTISKTCFHVNIIIIIRIPALKCSSSMLRPQFRLCKMAWVRGEGRESSKATNIYETGHNNLKRTNLHMHDRTRMETTNGYNHCATKPVHRRSVDNVTKHKNQLLNTGSTKLQENNAPTWQAKISQQWCVVGQVEMLLVASHVVRVLVGCRCSSYYSEYRL